MNLNKYDIVKQKTYFKRLGKVVNVVGLTIESNGPDAKLDDLCRIIVDAVERLGLVVGKVYMAQHPGHVPE